MSLTPSHHRKPSRKHRYQTLYDNEDEKSPPSFKEQLEEEQELCSRAVDYISKGHQLKIDWGTTSNFKIDLPQLKKKKKKEVSNP